MNNVPMLLKIIDRILFKILKKSIENRDIEKQNLKIDNLNLDHAPLENNYAVIFYTKLIKHFL